MYGYVEKPSKEFEAESLPSGVLPESDLSLLMVLDRDRKVVFQQGFDHAGGRFVRFHLQDGSASELWKSIVRTFSRPTQDNFVIASEFGPLIIVSSPIMHSDGQGPMNGRVIMGRLVDQTLIRRIGASIQERISLLTPVALQRTLNRDELQAMSSRDFYFKESQNFLSIYIMFRAPAGQAVFAIRIDADKTLFSLQDNAVRNFLIALLLCTMLAGTIYYRFIDRLLLQRLKNISKKTKHITSFEDLSIRIQEDRHDEIARLSFDINKMLERLEKENIRHQELERRLVLNEKLVATGRLAANIAHEINNPLFAISNSIAVIKRQMKNAGGDIGEVLPLAEKEITRVRKITRKLLDYGKINLETFRENDLDAILDTACKVLKLGRQIKGTAIARDRKEGERPIFCNPDSLQQVFMNLVLNASEAMNGRGEVAIEIDSTADAYEIHFRDSGPGFPAGIQKRIFEPFNSSKGTKGAGLGLYISYHIVKRHGGSMTLDESCPSGAHLIVRLPRRGVAENE
jgi:two-component system sporulation sensor kinase A